MNIDLIYRSHIAAFCYAAHLQVGPEATLALLFDSTPPDAPIQELQRQMQDGFVIVDEDAPIYQILLSLALIDIGHKSRKSVTTYLGTGPGEHPTTDALLGYDQGQKRWIILQLQNANYIVLRTLAQDEKGRPLLSPPGLLDMQELSLDGIRPLLDLDRHEATYTLLYHKPVPVHMEAAQIHKLDLALQAGWKDLQEQIAVIQQGAEIEQGLNWQRWEKAAGQQQTRYLLPENASFTPGEPGTSRSEEWRILGSATIAGAETAMSLVNGETRLLILCSPQKWVSPVEQIPSSSEQEKNEEWRIWLTGWDRHDATYQWSFTSSIGLPVDPGVPSYEQFPWPTIHIAAIPGPTTPQHPTPTFVVAMAMLKTDDQGEAGLDGEDYIEADAHKEKTGEVFSQAVCLDHKGQAVQICLSALGLRPYLCCSGQVVIGVDHFAGGWRLWNWFALRKDTLDTIVSLDGSCKRAFVHAEPASASFWLIEELPAGVRVSQHDTATLQETDTAFMPGTHLQQSQEDSRPLNGYRDVGIIPYQDSLFLLVKDENEALALYQIH